jgi:hypothetical protein
MTTDNKLSQSLGVRHEHTSTEQIREKIVMQFTESTLSHLIARFSLPKTDYLTRIKDIYTSINRYRLDLPERFLEAFDYDIRKPNKEVPPEKEKDIAEFLINGSYELLNSLTKKPIKELIPKEAGIINNFHALRTLEGNCYTTYGFRDLLMKDWEKKHPYAPILNSTTLAPHKTLREPFPPWRDEKANGKLCGVAVKLQS